MPDATPYDSTVERELSAGFALFELCEGEETALHDWGDNKDTLKTDAGRVGVESAASHHNPELVLTSWTREPGPAADGYDLVGQVEVDWRTDHVELWTSDSDIGNARQLTLPPSPTRRYQLRAARTFAPQVRGTLTDHLWEHDDVDNHGLERWRFDFWPA